MNERIEKELADLKQAAIASIEKRALCSVCQKELTVVEFDWCVDQNKKHSTNVFQHPRCFSAEELALIQSESISIPRHLFDKANAARLLFEPSPDEITHSLDHKSIQVQTEYWLVGQSFEYTRAFVRKMESVASAARLILNRLDREKNFSPEKEEAYWKRVEQERSIHAVKAPATAAKAERKVLSAEEKKLKFFMQSLGMSREDALASIKEAEEKAKSRGN